MFRQPVLSSSGMKKKKYRVEHFDVIIVEVNEKEWLYCPIKIEVLTKSWQLLPTTLSTILSRFDAFAIKQTMRGMYLETKNLNVNNAITNTFWILNSFVINIVYSKHVLFGDSVNAV